MNFGSGPPHRLPESRKKPLPVLIILVDRFAAIPAAHHMIKGAVKFDSHLSRRRSLCAAPSQPRQELFSDPYFLTLKRNRSRKQEVNAEQDGLKSEARIDRLMRSTSQMQRPFQRSPRQVQRRRGRVSALLILDRLMRSSEQERRSVSPEVPHGRWFKRFPEMTVYGDGELIKTFLTASKRRREQISFESGEKRLHAFMLGKQETVKKFAGSLTPRPRLGLFLRNHENLRDCVCRQNGSPQSPFRLDIFTLL